MNNILSINEESVILDILKEIPYQSLHEHHIIKNIHNNFRTVKRIKPEISQTGLYRFTLPEEGFLQGLCLSFSFSSDGNNINVEERAAARIFSEIWLKQGLKDLCKNTPSYILSRINQEPVQKQKNYIELTTFNQIFDNNEVTASVPIFCSFTDLESNYLLLNYFKRLEVHCQLNNDMLWQSTLTDMKVELVAFIKNYEPQYYNSFIYKEFQNFSKNYFSYDILNIKKTLEIGTSFTRIDLKGPFLIFAIHSIIFNNNWSNVPISRMILNCQGINVLDIKTSENAFIEPSYYQYNGNSLSYFFGSKQRHYHSGAININNGPWYLMIYHDPITEPGQLHTDLEYFCIFETDNSGIFEKNILY